jgi:hypothetical protein
MQPPMTCQELSKVRFSRAFVLLLRVCSARFLLVLGNRVLGERISRFKVLYGPSQPRKRSGFEFISPSTGLASGHCEIHWNS